MGEWVGPVTQWRCLSCETAEGFAGGALCRRCEASEAEAWQEFDRASNDHEAAIETLRAMLLEHACGLAEGARELRLDGETSGHLEPRACIAIALALLLVGAMMGEMTKGKTKPKGAKAAKVGVVAKVAKGPPAPKPDPNARARDIDWGSAMELWLTLIGNGETERHAASLVSLDFPGVSREGLRSRAMADPDGWGEGLAAAHGRKVADAERMLREIAKGPGPSATLLSVDPQLERVRASTLQWLLSKWDRETYGDAKKVEQSGPGGGPISHSVVRYELHAPGNALIGDDSSDD